MSVLFNSPTNTSSLRASYKQDKEKTEKNYLSWVQKENQVSL